MTVRSRSARTRNTTTRVLGPAVRALREARDIRHGVFAVECDISPGFLTRVEQGVKQPSPAVAATMAARLGVPLEAIQYELPECARCAKPAPAKVDAA